MYGRALCPSRALLLVLDREHHHAVTAHTGSCDKSYTDLYPNPHLLYYKLLTHGTNRARYRAPNGTVSWSTNNWSGGIEHEKAQHKMTKTHVVRTFYRHTYLEADSYLKMIPWPEWLEVPPVVYVCTNRNDRLMFDRHVLPTRITAWKTKPAAKT